MFNPAVWSWPQWTILIMLFLACAIQGAQHGKPRKDEFNGFIALTRFALWMFILIFGGFFA